MSLVAILDPIATDLDVERDVLEGEGHQLIVVGSEPDLRDPRLAKVAGLLTTDGQVTPDLLDVLPLCRVVATYGVGYDNIDVPAATARGVVVTNVPDYCTSEVADHTMALLLALERRIIEGDRLVRAGGWGADHLRPMRRLRGQTLGIVGLGRIGRAVAARAEAFGLRVVGFDPLVSNAEIETTDALEGLLARADIVSLHAPLTDRTRALVGPDAIAMMRPGARIINTSRGGLLDLGAALAGLDAGLLDGLALDVYPAEPPEIGRLRDRHDVVLSPHVGFLSIDAIAEARTTAAQTVASVLAGRQFDHRV